MKKSNIIYSLIILLVIVGLVLFRYSNKKEKDSLTICTEESLSYVVDDMIRYFNDTRETPVDFQVTYIPIDETQRAGICKRLRTELMTGKGTDIYILSEYKRNGGISEAEETLLLPDANKTLDSGVFKDVSEYTEDDESFQKCFAPVMEAGAVEGKQYILPFSFDTRLLKSIKEMNADSLTLEDCRKPLTQLLKEEKLQEMNPYEFLDVITWIGNSFDYQEGKIFFSKDDIIQVLEYATADGGHYDSDFITTCWSVPGAYESLHSFESYLDELQETEYGYLPMVTIDGRPAAKILSYGAIGRTCKNPELAYDFLRLFWQDKFISRDGYFIPHEDYKAYYYNATVLNLGGIPVREDLWEKWYLLKNGTSEPSEIAVKNAQNFSGALGQTVTARFLCTVDTLGIEINNMFMKDGYVSLDKDGIEEDIELAADMLYNNTRYIVME